MNHTEGVPVTVLVPIPRPQCIEIPTPFLSTRKLVLVCFKNLRVNYLFKRLFIPKKMKQAIIIPNVACVDGDDLFSEVDANRRVS